MLISLLLQKQEKKLAEKKEQLRYFKIVYSLANSRTVL